MSVSEKDYKDLHGIVMWLAWCLFGLIGILIPHFKSHFNHWLKLHMFMMNMSVLLTVAGFILIKQVEESDSNSAYLSYHKAAGVIFFIFILFQPVNGFFRPGKDTPHRKKWEMVHKNVGRIILVLCVSSMMYSGFHNIDRKIDDIYFKLHSVYLGVIFGIAGLLKFSCKKPIEDIEDIEEHVTEENHSITESITEEDRVEVEVIDNIDIEMT